MPSQDSRYSGVVAVVEPDAGLRTALMDALAELGLKPVLLTQDPLRADEVEELRVEAIVAGHASRAAVAGVYNTGAISPVGLLPDILYTGVADRAERADLLANGAVCVFEQSASAQEIALQTDAVLRQRHRLLEGTDELVESHDLLAQLQADLRLGARIQQSFLPPLSINTPAFTLEARIQASWTLSGDFFDYKFITPERLAVFIADISGHGVASALLASRLKAFFDEHYRNARRPARTLELLNHMLIELGEHQQFSTAVLLCLDVAEGSLIYANAGHRTLYLLDREQGHYTPLPSSGPALGLFEDCEMGERDFSFLPRRKRLVAYTDGLVEFKSHTHGEWVSEEEFIDQLILPNMHLPIAGFTDSVFSGSLRLSGGEKWDDDVCLVVVDC